MPRNAAWLNSDGLVVGFGTRTSDKEQSSKLPGAGSVHEVVLEIDDATELGTDATAGTGIYAPQYVAQAVKIPANATIKSARVIAKTGATSAGAADLLVGTYTVNATTKAVSAVDPDGLVAAADAALADLANDGDAIDGGGAVIDNTVGTTDVVVLATYVTAAYTAGAFKIVVSYEV